MLYTSGKYYVERKKQYFLAGNAMVHVYGSYMHHVLSSRGRKGLTDML